MLEFRIAAKDTHILGVRIPAGACYGHIMTFDGSKIVKDKHGKAHVKTRCYEHDIYYWCDDFKPVYVKNKNGKVFTHFYVHVYDKKRDKWNNFVCTAQSSMYYDLAELLERELYKRNLLFGDKPTSDYIPKSVLPKERKHQVYSDSAFGCGKVGYALSSWSKDYDPSPIRRY